MQEFEFYGDQKNTIWYRVNFSIEAETKEEAIEKVKQMYEEQKSLYDFGIHWEIIDDTAEDITVEANNGWATEEIFDAENPFAPIITNGKF